MVKKKELTPASLFGRASLKLYDKDDELVEITIAGKHVFVSRTDPGLKFLRPGRGNNVQQFVALWNPPSGKTKIAAIFKNPKIHEWIKLQEIVSNESPHKLLQFARFPGKSNKYVIDAPLFDF